eukprot:GABV01009700.1.p1 GENE.GABV01009700.1~~GABV01009700.1.p1  ORF type:complete len:162 (+),score=49.64 GABV01009700.1:110-595(+)
MFDPLTTFSRAISHPFLFIVTTSNDKKNTKMKALPTLEEASEHAKSLRRPPKLERKFHIGSSGQPLSYTLDDRAFSSFDRSQFASPSSLSPSRSPPKTSFEGPNPPWNASTDTGRVYNAKIRAPWDRHVNLRATPDPTLPANQQHHSPEKLLGHFVHHRHA